MPMGLNVQGAPPDVAANVFEGGPVTHFVLIHGAWHGGWCWARTAGLLEAAGHRVTAPTLSGLAERAGQVSRRINLTTHVDDIVDHVRGLGDQPVILVGHSYGGFPATAAARRLGGQAPHLVLLDAFVPVAGEILLDHAPALIAPYRQAADADEAWNIPPIPSAAFGVGPEDQAWVDAKLTPQPVETYFEPVVLADAPTGQRQTYIRCAQAPGDLLAASVRRVRSDPAWSYVEIDAPHDAMISHPDLLAQALLAADDQAQN